MAWGLWNKIKQGFKKAGAVVKKVADVVTDKVIKPFKPFIAGAIGAVNPAAGAVAHRAMDAVERFRHSSGEPYLGAASDEGFTPFRRLQR